MLSTTYDGEIGQDFALRHLATANKKPYNFGFPRGLVACPYGNLLA